VLLAIALLVMFTGCGSTGQTGDASSTGNASASTGQTQQNGQPAEKITLRVTSLTSFGMGLEKNQEIFNTFS